MEDGRIHCVPRRLRSSLWLFRFDRLRSAGPDGHHGIGVHCSSVALSHLVMHDHRAVRNCGCHRGLRSKETQSVDDFYRTVGVHLVSGCMGVSYI
ncbi:hypothetical protein D9M72_550630 [compost metagenome]